MNATTLELTNWATEAQRMAQKAIFYAPIAYRAFKISYAPRIAEVAAGITAQWYESECYWRSKLLTAMGITHNPIASAIKAAIAELTSTEALASYARAQYLAKEATAVVIAVGVCGVVAIASGIELAQKIYRQAKIAYAWVDAKLNPPEVGPVILPTVALALDEQVEILSDEDKEFDRQFMERLEKLDAVKEAIWYVPVIGEVWNSPVKDMHQEDMRIVANATSKASKHEEAKTDQAFCKG